MSKDIEKKILDATLETIAREKISGTRMHLIADEANMSQSNLHYYFPTKNDLIIALMDDLQKRFSSKRTESIDVKNKSLNENIHGILEEKKYDILNNKKVDYAQFDFWVQGTVNPEIRVKFQKTFEEWRENIKEVLEHNKVPSTIDSKNAEMLPFIIVSLMMGASMQYLIDEGKFDLDEYFTACEKLVLEFLENMA
ncbi:TetR/AcrR family transcriptional regulator [Candidatus Clostridium stratigraminis]|uniref:TetR/AcrR family transcriptional regulator n=1 Tax=Candidatus Clostridium stratigraminis TaxID=3381661 RepID=A0ABW8SZX2_9CLOT